MRIMYKDKEKQREANRKAAKRYRDNKKGMTTESNTITPVIPSNTLSVIPDTGYQRNYEIQAHKPEPQSHNSMMVGYVPPEGSL